VRFTRQVTLLKTMSNTLYNQPTETTQSAHHHHKRPMAEGVTGEILNQPGDAANWSQNQPPFAEKSRVIGAIPTDYAHSDATLQVPVVQTTTTFELKEVDIPVQTVPLERSAAPIESSSRPELSRERELPLARERELPLARERELPLARERELPFEREVVAPPPPVQPMPVCAPASNDVFREAASKAPEFISRIENREREVMRVHERAEFEIKKDELKHKKEEMKHEAQAEKKLQESAWHREMVFQHGNKLEETQLHLVSEHEMLRRFVLQLTEEMRREHNNYMEKLEGVKNLINQRTQEISLKQREQLQEQSQHYEMMKKHEAEIQQSRVEAEEHARMAEFEREKKEEARLLAERQKELKEVHKENVDDARQMPGGSGMVGGIRDAAHKAKVALGLK